MSDITPEAQPTESVSQDPQVTPTPSTPEPVQGEPTQAAPQGGQGPWANDLAQRFADEGVRGQVDEFLRGSVQPHVTRLEQDLAKYEPAHRLFDDLTSNPQETWLAVTAEIYGPEVAQQLAAALEADFEDDTDEYDDSDENAPEGGQLSADQQEAINWANQQRVEAYYNSQIERISPLAAEQGVEFDEYAFAPFVTAAGGDFDLALANYVPYMQAQEQRIMARLGLNPNGEAESEEAPPVLGTQPAGQTTPPVAEHYDSIADALDATLAEMKANRENPVAVGSV